MLLWTYPSPYLALPPFPRRQLYDTSASRVCSYGLVMLTVEDAELKDAAQYFVSVSIGTQNFSSATTEVTATPKWGAGAWSWPLVDAAVRASALASRRRPTAGACCDEGPQHAYCATVWAQHQPQSHCVNLQGPCGLLRGIQREDSGPDTRADSLPACSTALSANESRNAAVPLRRA